MLASVSCGPAVGRARDRLAHLRVSIVEAATDASSSEYICTFRNFVETSTECEKGRRDEKIVELTGCVRAVQRSRPRRGECGRTTEQDQDRHPAPAHRP